MQCVYSVAAHYFTDAQLNGMRKLFESKENEKY